MKSRKPAHILVVDDEEFLRESLVYEFKKNGFRVSSAENGKQALARLRADPADFVVSDIRMPGGDGIELLSELKKDNPLIPFVLLVTGYAEITLKDARARGADALLTKPFDRKILVDMVTNLLNRQASELDFQQAIGTQCALTFLARNQITSGPIVNVNENGMFICFEADFLPELNEAVHFSIQFNGRSIIGNGTVTMVKIRSSDNFQSGCGIQFSYLTDEAKRSVVEVIQMQKLGDIG